MSGDIESCLPRQNGRSICWSVATRGKEKSLLITDLACESATNFRPGTVFMIARFTSLEDSNLAMFLRAVYDICQRNLNRLKAAWNSVWNRILPE
jgi:hypothetical protein